MAPNGHRDQWPKSQSSIELGHPHAWPTSDPSIDRVAEAAGFGSTASLRQHFVKAFSVSPTAWRRGFRGPR